MKYGMSVAGVVLVAMFVSMPAGGALRGVTGARSHWVMAVLGGGVWSEASAINNKGQIVGNREKVADGDVHGFLWRNGKMTDLGGQPIAINERGQVLGNDFLWQNGKLTVFGKGSSLTAINDRGQVIGSRTKSGKRHAFLWQGGRTVDLCVLGGLAECEAVALNNRGIVVGSSLTPGGKDVAGFQPLAPARAFLWRNDKLTDLGRLPGQKRSAAVAINDRGQILGYSYSTFDDVGGGAVPKDWFVWQNGKMTNLGPLAAWRINNHGQIIGVTGTKGVDQHAGLWQNGKLTDLGTFGGEQSDASAINDRGQIVGQAEDARLADRPFVWQNGKLVRLPDLGLTDCLPIALNEHNQIIGTCRKGLGDPRAVLWTVKP